MISSRTPRGRRTPGFARRGALGIVAILVAACASKFSDAAVLRANGITTEATTGPGTPSGSVVNPGTVPGSPVSRDTAPIAPTAGASGLGPTSSGSLTPGRNGQSTTRTVGTPGETGPIVLGNVGTYSGPAGASTAGIPKAVQIWAAYVNQRGGLFGRQVQVIVQDDGGDPARFASAVQDLVENRHVIAFVGESSLGLQAGTGYLESKGIPVIGTDCSTADWYKSADFFPQCGPINPSTAGLGLKAAAGLTGKKRLGIVYCTETPICSAGNTSLMQGAARYGVDVVYDASISLAQIDFTANCQAARDKGADLFTVVGDANTASRFARSCSRQTYQPQYVQPSITANSGTTSTPGLTNVILTLQTFPFAGLTTPGFKEFADAMASVAPNEIIGPATSYGWAAAKLFELAANRAAAATGSLNPKSLLAAMHTIKGETLGGLTVALDFTGSTPNNQQCAFIMQADGAGKWSLPVGSAPYC
jgi:branched-chain amino acid transport system substrate-binding protein